MTSTTPTEPEALAACPFCGGEAERFTIQDEGDNFGGDVVCCKECGASSHVEFGRKENLVSCWNRRTPAARLLAGEVEAVAYASPEQMASMGDPIGDMAGAYIPLRKTSAGKFTMPLYAHPPAAEPVGLREAVEGIDDDYMTSEKHHPGYVLIPTAKFEQIVSAAERAKEIVPPYYVNWHHDADKALATPARTDDAGVGGDENAIAAIIKAQMREQWDEICSDSGCHPLDIEKRGRSTYYKDRHWTSAVAKYAAQDILAALSPAPDRGEGEA